MMRRMAFSRAAVVATLSLLALSACGNDPSAVATKGALPKPSEVLADIAGLFSKRVPVTPDPAAVAATRAALEQAGNPVIVAGVAKTGYFNALTPYGQNGGVTTWASSTLETVALQNGMLVATRGFGSDLMAAKVPDVGQVRAATGSFHRVYSYLDGADQGVVLEYDCTYAQAGSEQVNVFGRSYALRKVVESCSGAESTFQNAYWFEGSGTLRQSDQRLSPKLQILRVQRVID